MKPHLSFRASPRVEESTPKDTKIPRQARDDNEQAATGTSKEVDEQEKEWNQFELLKERMTRTS